MDVVSKVSIPVSQPTVAKQVVPNTPLDIVVDPSNIDAVPPLSKYVEVKGKPYTADYLNIFFWNALTPELDVNGIQKNVEKIEDFVAEEIERYQLEDTVDSYEEVMDRIKHDLNMSRNETVESKIQKVLTYIKVLQKHRAKEERDKHLSNLAKRLQLKLKAGELT